MRNVSIHSNELEIWSPDPDHMELLDKRFYEGNNIKFVRFKEPMLHSYNRFNVLKKLDLLNYETREPLEKAVVEN